MTGLLLWTAAAAWLAAAAASTWARLWPFLRASALLSSAGGAVCLAAGISLIVAGHPTARVAATSDLVGGLNLQATPLAAVFIILLGVVAVAIGLYLPGYHHPASGTAAYLCAYNLTLLASLVVLTAEDVTTFLVAWESMTLLCGLLVLRHRSRSGVARGAILFLSLGEIGFALIVLSLVIMTSQTHSMDFAVIASRAHAVGPGWKSAAFLLALAGFGCKAGLVPTHVWLPAAHPVAPADGSAFLSGLIVKLGIYGIVLVAFDLDLGGPAWWGLLTMAIGALSAAVGILYAMVEADLKRFLAYSTVENVGVIATALGAAMVFRSDGQATLGTLMLIAALYHVINHGTYKTLLFLEAGVTEHAAGTRDLNQLGGLVHRLRASSVIALVGTLGIAALPPLNGFVSEWLIFQGLFQAFRVHDPLTGVLMVLAAATLGLTGGLAIMAFARAYGIGYLGMPRSAGADHATETGQPVVGPGLLAAVCVALGIGAPAVLIALDRAARYLTGTDIRASLVTSKLTVIPGHTNFSAFSPTYLAVFLVAVSVVPLAIYLAARPRGATRRVPVWDGGMTRYRPRMQYSSTTFSNPVRVTFDRLYRPDIEIDRASDDPAGRSGPVHYRIEVLPLFERYLYQPVIRIIKALARLVQQTQSGDVNLYLLYILLTVLIACLIYGLS